MAVALFDLTNKVLYDPLKITYPYTRSDLKLLQY